ADAPASYGRRGGRDQLRAGGTGRLALVVRPVLSGAVAPHGGGPDDGRAPEAEEAPGESGRGAAAQQRRHRPAGGAGRALRRGKLTPRALRGPLRFSLQPRAACVMIEGTQSSRELSV